MTTVLDEALRLAERAPSGGGLSWRVGDGTLDLFAASPDEILACGAALHHVRVALAAMGWNSRVTRFPDSGEPGHVATVRSTWESCTPDAACAAAISLRRSDLRGYSDEAVPWSALTWLMERAHVEGASLQPVISATLRAQLLPLITDVPPESAGVLLVLATEQDDDLARLRAGEAMSAVLLAATAWGLASCALPEQVAVPAVHDLLHRRAFARMLHPQAVLRVGWQHPNAAPLPNSPR